MSPRLSYRLAISEPHARRIDVEMELRQLEGRREQVVCMPVWTPGSYKVREYSKHVLGVRCRDGQGRELAWEKRDKASWRIDLGEATTLRINYQVYAHQVSPRFNHVDTSHAFINPVATCMYPEGELNLEVEAQVEVPQGWNLYCGLEADEGHLRADDLDHWFDSPIELGDHVEEHFQIEGKDHQVVGWSEDDVDLEGLKRDLPAIIEAHADLFGEIPYDRYVFINHILPGRWGGLEHRHSSVNLFTPEAVNAYEIDEDEGRDEDYLNVLRLLSHEHFHAYHVKRLRPKELGPFDYQRENYTSSLWAVEGVTSYYDSLQVMRAGLMDVETYLEGLEKRISSVEKVPGRLEQSLEESSFDAWIGLYRRDENTVNSTVSYYSKGELAVWLIDLWIRVASGGEKSMDDVLRWMWQHYVVDGDEGFEARDMERGVREVSGEDPGQVFEALVYRAEEIDYGAFLSPMGLELSWEQPSRGWLGMETKTVEGQRAEIKWVARHSPAERGGLAPGDELVAIDGRAVRKEEWKPLVERYEGGQKVRVHVVRRGRLKAMDVEVGSSPRRNPKLERSDELSDSQNELLEGWLGQSQWEQS